jgi:hemerythrin-like domain-containing protein
MTFTNRICRTLHEEHDATIALMERLERLLARHRDGSPPGAGDPALARLLSDLVTGLSTEVARHFDFEEDHLFTMLGEIGEDGIGCHLRDEHLVIRPIGAKIVQLVREAQAQGFDQARWDEFRRLGLDLCDRLTAHAQKEESALLPLVEDNMDAETEARLYQDYVENA